MWKFGPILALLCAAAACGGEGENVDAGDAGGPDMRDEGFDEIVDMGVPDPPRALAPCEATDCRADELGGPPCSVFTTAATFTGRYGVHSFSSMVWDGAPTRITVAPKTDWDPVIVLARLNGEVLFDGDVGAVRPPFEVVAEGPADIVVSTVQATAIVVYVTSVGALESDFAQVPDNAGYDLTITSDCGERVRCVVNGRDTGDPQCSWLHYVGRRVVNRLEGTRDQRLLDAALGSWWALKEDRLDGVNPIVASQCRTNELGPLETCTSDPWPVGLAGANAANQDLVLLEELASRLYDGAMTSGILRTTANEAALNRSDVEAVMASEGELRASWLLRNSAVGLSTRADWVNDHCIETEDPSCFGSGSAGSRYYGISRDAALQSINDLQALFDQLAD